MRLKPIMIRGFIKKVKAKIKKILKYLSYYFYFVFNYNRKSIVLIGTPSHSNIGDLAITYAEKKLIKESGYNPIEITYSEAVFYYRLLRILLRNKTLILHGGGNMGDVWFNEELLRRSIINGIHAKKFIIMPQTIYYNNTDSGHQKEQESINYYNKNNVIMFLRDNNSYNKAKELYPAAEIHLSSDIVLSLLIENSYRRNGKALLVFRSDIEKKIDDSVISLIRHYLESKSIEYDITDMYTPDKVTKEKSESIVKGKLEVFSKYKFVITDRLHGMIFSTITSTPCVAFNNNNKKVEGTYDFLKNQGYIYLCNSYEDFKNKIGEVITNNNVKYNKQLLENYYINIRNVIKLNR